MAHAFAPRLKHYRKRVRAWRDSGILAFAHGYMTSEKHLLLDAAAQLPSLRISFGRFLSDGSTDFARAATSKPLLDASYPCHVRISATLDGSERPAYTSFRSAFVRLRGSSPETRSFAIELSEPFEISIASLCAPGRVDMLLNQPVLVNFDVLTNEAPFPFVMDDTRQLLKYACQLNGEFSIDAAKKTEDCFASVKPIPANPPGGWPHRDASVAIRTYWHDPSWRRRFISANLQTLADDRAKRLLAIQRSPVLWVLNARDMEHVLPVKDWQCAICSSTYKDYWPLLVHTKVAHGDLNMKYHQVPDHEYGSRLVFEVALDVAARAEPSGGLSPKTSAADAEHADTARLEEPSKQAAEPSTGDEDDPLQFPTPRLQEPSKQAAETTRRDDIDALKPPSTGLQVPSDNAAETSDRVEDEAQGSPTRDLRDPSKQPVETSDREGDNASDSLITRLREPSKQAAGASEPDEDNTRDNLTTRLQEPSKQAAGASKPTESEALVNFFIHMSKPSKQAVETLEEDEDDGPDEDDTPAPLTTRLQEPNKQAAEASERGEDNTQDNLTTRLQEPNKQAAETSRRDEDNAQRSLSSASRASSAPANQAGSGIQEQRQSLSTSETRDETVNMPMIEDSDDEDQQPIDENPQNMNAPQPTERIKDATKLSLEEASQVLPSRHTSTASSVENVNPMTPRRAQTKDADRQRNTRPLRGTLRSPLTDATRLTPSPRSKSPPRLMLEKLQALREAELAKQAKAKPATRTGRRRLKIPKPPEGVQFYSSITKVPLYEGESASESDASSDDKPIRIELKGKSNANKFKNIFNAHMQREHMKADSHFKGCWKRFAEQYGPLIKKHRLMEDFVIRAATAKLDGLLTDEDIVQSVTVVQAAAVERPSPAQPPSPKSRVGCPCGKDTSDVMSIISCHNVDCVTPDFHLACVGLDSWQDGWLCPERRTEVNGMDVDET